MEKLAIITDAGSDIDSILNELNWEELFVCHLYVNFGSESYKSTEISSQEFFEKVSGINKKNFPKTAASSPQDFLDLYNVVKSKGFTQAIYISVADKLSATINSGRIAADEVEDLEIAVIDSNSVSIGQLALVFKTKHCIENGMEFAEIVSKLNEQAPTTEIFASLNTLENLVKGGRMSPIRYWLGNLLKIKPVLRLNQGEVHPFEKIKGVEKSRERAYYHSTKNWKKDDEFHYLIAHGNNEALGISYVEKLQSEFRNAKGHLVSLGPVLGVHTGQDSLLLITFK